MITLNTHHHHRRHPSYVISSPGPFLGHKKLGALFSMQYFSNIFAITIKTWSLLLIMVIFAVKSILLQINQQQFNTWRMFFMSQKKLYVCCCNNQLVSLSPQLLVCAFTRNLHHLTLCLVPRCADGCALHQANPPPQLFAHTLQCATETVQLV